MRILAILSILFVSVAHAQSPTPTPWWTTVPTWTPSPTWTAIPTFTPVNTPTPIPTWTPSATWTPRPTWTASPTWTAVPTHSAATPTPTPTPTLPTTPYAVPGAFGAGRFTQGGRGGSICKVTTGADTNPSSPVSGELRYCLQTVSGARYIVFDGVSKVTLTKMIEVNTSDDDVTVFGQSAPGASVEIDCTGVSAAGGDWGNCVRNYTGWDNVIWQYTKFRSGVLTNASPPIVYVTATPASSPSPVYQYQQEGHAISLTNVTNQYWYHNTFTHGQDETVTINGHDKVTFDSNIISAGTTYDHFSACMIIYASSNPGSYDEMTLGRNLFSHCQDRTPEIKTGTVEMVNNLILYSNSMRQSTAIRGGSVVDFIGNWWKGHSFLDMYIRAQGPGSNTLDTGPTGDPSIYMANNKTKYLKHTSSSADQWKITRWTTEASSAGSTRARPTPSPSRTPIGYTTNDKILDIVAAEPTITGGVGASKYMSPTGSLTLSRDSLDDRLVNDWKRGTGVVPYNDAQPVPIPTPVGGASRTDSDGDGMHDAYETATYGSLTRNQNYDGDGDGFTAIEEYYLGTDPAVANHF